MRDPGQTPIGLIRTKETPDLVVGSREGVRMFKSSQKGHKNTVHMVSIFETSPETLLPFIFEKQNTLRNSNCPP